MDAREDTPAGGRLVAIDILRGMAIIWVVLFHLWGDLEFFPGAPREYYEQLTWQVRQGNGAWATFTSFTDLLFRDGFQGVPLFMMISGISLTVAACRAGDASLAFPRLPGWFAGRFRKLLLPYWAGVGLTYGVMALIAWRQVAIDGGAFGDHLTRGVTISRASLVTVDRDTVIASIALVPRLTSAEWFFAPQLALWFVGLLAQYYLLFPILFVLMRRIGVAAFLLLTFGITVGANWWIVDNYGAPEFKFWLVTGWAPFRLFEFTAGMALGWLLAAPSAAPARTIARHPAALLLAVLAGFAAHTTGDLLIGRWTVRYWQSLALPLTTLGLGCWALAVLSAWPGRFDRALAVRALATVGVMSYGILIVSDAMRLVASQLRVEDVPDPIWWTFLIAVYVPASIVLAWPLCRVLGLMPKGREAGERMRRGARTAVPRAEPEVATAAAGGSG